MATKNDVEDLLGDTGDKKAAPKKTADKAKTDAKAAPKKDAAPAKAPAKKEEAKPTKNTAKAAPADKKAAPAKKAETTEKAPRAKKEPVRFEEGEREALSKKIKALVKKPINSKELAAKLEIETRKLRPVLYSMYSAGMIELASLGAPVLGLEVSPAAKA